MSKQSMKKVDEFKAKVDEFKTQKAVTEGFGASVDSPEVLEVVKAFESAMTDIKGLPFSTIMEIVVMFVSLFVKDPTMQETIKRVLDLIGQLIK